MDRVAATAHPDACPQSALDRRGSTRSGVPFLVAHLSELETGELEIDVRERRILVDVELSASLSLASKQVARQRLDGEHAVLERALGRDVLQLESGQLDLIDMQDDCRIVLSKPCGTHRRFRKQQRRTAVRRSAPRCAQADVRDPEQVRLELDVELRSRARGVDADPAVHVALSGMHRQIVEIEMQTVALELARQSIGARIDHMQPDQIIEVLQVLAAGREGRFHRVEIERAGQYSLTFQVRAARALGVGEMIGTLMTRGGERVALDLEGCRMPVQIALAPDPDLCSSRRAFRGCDPVELQMPAIIVERHVRARHRKAAHDGELPLGMRNGGVVPLPVGAALCIAYEMQTRAREGQAVDAESVMQPRHLEHQAQRADLRGAPGWHPAGIADDDALGGDAGCPGEQLDSQGTVDGDRASGANGDEVQERSAKESRLHSRRKSRHRRDHESDGNGHSYKPAPRGNPHDASKLLHPRPDQQRVTEVQYVPSAACAPL